MAAPAARRQPALVGTRLYRKYAVVAVAARAVPVDQHLAVRRLNAHAVLLGLKHDQPALIEQPDVRRSPWQRAPRQDFKRVLGIDDGQLVAPDDRDACAAQVRPRIGDRRAEIKDVFDVRDHQGLDRLAQHLLSLRIGAVLVQRRERQMGAQRGVEPQLVPAEVGEILRQPLLGRLASGKLEERRRADRADDCQRSSRADPAADQALAPLALHLGRAGRNERLRLRPFRRPGVAPAKLDPGFVRRFLALPVERLVQFTTFPEVNLAIGMAPRRAEQLVQFAARHRLGLDPAAQRSPLANQAFVGDVDHRGVRQRLGRGRAQETGVRAAQMIHDGGDIGVIAVRRAADDAAQRVERQWPTHFGAVGPALGQRAHDARSNAVQLGRQRVEQQLAVAVQRVLAGTDELVVFDCDGARAGAAAGVAAVAGPM